jgi:hypothetical protein
VKRIAAILVLALLPISLRASALDLEKLVMPGPVIQGHADVESECEKCHAPFRSEAQNELCADCHKAVAGDLARGEGFHGLAPGASRADCRSCHTEHQGREADVVALDRETFDHTFTDHVLEGAHNRVSCEACHPRAEKFRDAPDRCVDCHADDDVHAGSLGKACADCHTEQVWGEARFDHDRTRFPLAGKHRDADCGLCHPGGRYERTALDCRSCHGLDDVHLGGFGADCERCHSAEGWKKTKFNHDRDTKFPLRGGHRAAACESCHEAGKLEPLPAADCSSCHRADDPHRGRYGARCEQCHGESDWRSTIFDHDRSTNFPLRGAHQEVTCRECHTGRVYEEKIAAGCNGCHEKDDVHRGQQGTECVACHNESGWASGVFFDHDLTRFPLLGLHAVSACEQCHLNERFKEARIECSSCHEDDDVHLRRLGSGCEDCHNPNGWKFWRFDHDTRTSFALRGAHEGLGCHACHKLARTDAGRVAADCAECHARDDRHFGAFGLDCGRCHGDASWRDVELTR